MDYECLYLQELVKFIANERYLSRVGGSGSNHHQGLSALWRNSVTQKIEQFNIINHLQIVKNYCQEPDPLIYFDFTTLTAPLHNFRVGDLCILYPVQGAFADILKEQVFKSTIVDMTAQGVCVRLRSRQKNSKIFQVYDHWHIEHDKLDNGYTAMTRNVLEFASHPKTYRDLLLMQRPPSSPSSIGIDYIEEMTQQQNDLFKEIINASDYYLLWGPPGTGKTSIVIRNLAKYYIEHTQERVLYLAYTNRAVDEICHAIESHVDSTDYIRIGSRYSTANAYREKLLNHKLSTCSNRQDVTTVLNECLLYTGTLASVLGKTDLFELLEFDIVIIDEASQILEAQLIGLLGRFKKFVLIGDHRQLPAVTQQANRSSILSHPPLRDIGVTNFRNSLFERMYSQVQLNGWQHAYGQLKYQGRMHQELMDFANTHFYNGSLEVLPGMDRLIASLGQSNMQLGAHRLIYLDTEADIDGSTIKVNRHEADACAMIVRDLVNYYQDSDKEITSDTIGIITPYRAQIACIRAELSKLSTDYIDLISIDTVERYQGSARDIIILSTCMNYSYQLRSLQSLSDDGIDRKLNVAFTRTREQFILVGNKSLLSQSDGYLSLIEKAQSYAPSVDA